METRFLFALAITIVNSGFAQQVLYCSGTVRDPSGAPAPGVRVEYYPGHHQGAGHYTEAVTDANGRYEIVGPKDMAIYNGIIVETNSVMARDLERNLAAVQEFHMKTTTVDLVLQSGITISGSVKNTEDAPITGAEVKLGFLASRSSHLLEGQPTKVNDLGAFSVPALPQGRAYSIWGITAKGYGSGSARVKTEDTQTNRYEFPPFVLKRADRKIAGRVLDKAGNPLSGVEVYFMGKGQPQNFTSLQKVMNSTNTDREGRFHFDAVCEAPLKVYVANLNGGGGMPVQPGDTNIVIRLER